MLMLVAIKRTEPEEAELEGVALGLRFFDSKEGCARVERLLKTQVRKRFPSVDVKKEVEFMVYEPRTTNAGWPKWLGESGWYK